MIEIKQWKEFKDCGMLWWTNRLLHTFGWAIVYNYDKSDESEEPDDVYIARVKFRGFAEESEERGFKRVSKYMVENAEKLAEEAEE